MAKLICNPAPRFFPRLPIISHLSSHTPFSYREAEHQTTLTPDGQGSHWLRIDAPLLQASDVAIGDTVAFRIAPMTVEPEPVVPSDLQQALTDHPAARTTWDDITPVARRDWIFWITSGKKAETRTKRIHTACDMLASGKRRACCFDRSGMYSKTLSAPEAAKE